MATGQTHKRAVARLTDRGVRPTQQRVRVLAELMGERNDATAQELHARLRAEGRRIGLATVYRTLAVLVDEGIVDALSHHDGERCYRLCGAEHHHHLVCTECHRVVELTDCRIGDWLARVSGEQGFVATGHSLEVTGLCSACR
jgi:Fur family ferric uptake transcriptional regulator